MDVTGFLLRFPAFEGTETTLIDAKLAEATRGVDPEVFGDKTEDAIGYKAAHLLSIDPFGQTARIEAEDGSTTYGKQFMKIARSVTSGFRVI